MTRSSTEAEIVALSDGITQVMWFKLWMGEQGHQVAPVSVHQDNEAVESEK